MLGGVTISDPALSPLPGRIGLQFSLADAQEFLT